MSMIVFKDEAQKFGCPYCGAPLDRTIDGGSRRLVPGVMEDSQTCLSRECQGRTFYIAWFDDLDPNREKAVRGCPDVCGITYPHPKTKL